MSELVSVIIPVYNAAPFLKDSIESVIAQTYSNIEIICINDGSTDNSLEILKSFSSIIETPLEVSESESVEKFNKLLKILSKFTGFNDILKDGQQHLKVDKGRNS